MKDDQKFVTATHEKNGELTYFEVEIGPRKLSRDERGIVCCPVEITINDDPNKGPRSFTAERVFDPQELRFASLFWDAIDCPSGMLMGTSPDIEFLQEEGIVYRSHINHFTDVERDLDMQFIASSDPVAATGANNYVSPGLWSIQHGSTNEGHGLARKGGSAAVFHLHSVIPVPDRDVPIAELLEFKLKRSAELRALRVHLEDLYLKIISSPFPELAESIELQRLQVAIANHIRVAKESSMLLRLTGFKAKLDLNSATAASAGYMAAADLHLTPALQFLAGTVGGMLGSLSRDIGVGGFGEVGRPFEYVSLIHTDLFT